LLLLLLLGLPLLLVLGLLLPQAASATPVKTARPAKTGVLNLDPAILSREGSNMTFSLLFQ
jgi:hypothetical protein